MAGPRSQAVLAISRCAQDSFYEHTVAQFRLCNNCHASSRLLCADRHVKFHRAILSTAPKVNTCSVCACILTTIIPAHECDKFYEHTVARFRLCNNCHTTSRLLRADRHVQYHRVILSTSPKISTCSICARILTTITPAHECDICLDAIFNFLRSVTPSEAKIIYDTHLTDTVSIRIGRTHTYL